MGEKDWLNIYFERGMQAIKDEIFEGILQATYANENRYTWEGAFPPYIDVEAVKEIILSWFNDSNIVMLVTVEDTFLRITFIWKEGGVIF